MQSLWRIVSRFLKKIKLESSYDPVIPVLGIYPKETTIVTQNHVCTPMFIAVVLTVTKIWKQTKCPLSDEWIIKCGVYTHTHTHTHTHTGWNISQS